MAIFSNPPGPLGRSAPQVPTPELRREALDPNTPPKRLLELISLGCTGEVLDNPSLPLVLLEAPAFWREVKYSAVEVMLRHPRCPVEFAESVAGRPQEEQVYAKYGLFEKLRGPLIAGNKALPVELRREALLDMPNVPDDLWTSLAPVREELLTDAERRLLERGREALQSSAKFSEAELLRLGELGWLGMALALAQENCPPSLQAQGKQLWISPAERK
jgi:hypothetical protein